MRRYRLIGGPKHGELVALQYGGVLDVAVSCYEPGAFIPVEKHDICQVPPIHKVRYGTRRINLGLATATVVVPEDMSEGEVARRLADFIEGTK